MVDVCGHYQKSVSDPYYEPTQSVATDGSSGVMGSGEPKVIVTYLKSEKIVDTLVIILCVVSDIICSFYFF